MNTTLGGSIMGRTCYQEFEPSLRKRGDRLDEQNYRSNAKTANSLKQALSLTTKKTMDLWRRAPV